MLSLTAAPSVVFRAYTVESNLIANGVCSSTAYTSTLDRSFTVSQPAGVPDTNFSSMATSSFINLIGVTTCIGGDDLIVASALGPVYNITPEENTPFEYDNFPDVKFHGEFKRTGIAQANENCTDYRSSTTLKAEFKSKSRFWSWYHCGYPDCWCTHAVWANPLSQAQTNRKSGLPPQLKIR